MTTIERRKDVNPKEGKREHGDVEFADPVNKKISHRYRNPYSRGLELHQPQR